MAFDFNEVTVPETFDTIGNQFLEILAINKFEKFTDGEQVGKMTGHEVLEARGCLIADEKYYIADPWYYLNLAPQTHANFGVIILEPNTPNPGPLFDEKFLDLPQLVFQQVYGEITPDGVIENSARNNKKLHLFKGICKVTEVDSQNNSINASKNYLITKLWDIFYFKPARSCVS